MIAAIEGAYPLSGDSADVFADRWASSAKADPWLLVTPDGRIEVVPFYVQKRREVVRAVAAGEARLLVAWRGAYKSDVYEVPASVCAKAAF